MSDDLISRQAAIDAFYAQSDDDGWWTGTGEDFERFINGLPAVQESRIVNMLSGKTAEEQYEFLDWLLHIYGMQFTDSRLAVIRWLEGDGDE